MSLTIGDVLVKVLADDVDFQKDIDKKASAAGKKAGKTIGEQLGVNLKTAVVGAGIGTAFSMAIKSGAAFEDQLRTINTVAHLTDQQLAGVGDGIQAMARETGKSTDDLTAGFYDLVSAGVPADKAMKVLKDSAVLATGALGTTGEAVDLVTSALNAYGLGAENSTRITDIFAQAVADGKVTAAELGTSIANIAPIAAAAGVRLEEVAAGYALMTAKGTPAAQAATQMRAAISALITPNVQLAEASKQVGVNFAELAKEKGLAVALEKLREAVGGNDEAFAKALGSTEAYQYALAVTGENAAAAATELHKIEAGAKQGGVALGQYTEKSKSTVEQGKRLQQTIATLVQDLGKLGGGIAPLVLGLGQMGQALSGISGAAAAIGFTKLFSGLRGVIETQSAAAGTAAGTTFARAMAADEAGLAGKLIAWIATAWRRVPGSAAIGAAIGRANAFMGTKLGKGVGAVASVFIIGAIVEALNSDDVRSPLDKLLGLVGLGAKLYEDPYADAGGEGEKALEMRRVLLAKQALLTEAQTRFERQSAAERQAIFEEARAKIVAGEALTYQELFTVQRAGGEVSKDIVAATTAAAVEQWRSGGDEAVKALGEGFGAGVDEATIGRLFSKNWDQVEQDAYTAGEHSGAAAIDGMQAAVQDNRLQESIRGVLGLDPAINDSFASAAHAIAAGRVSVAEEFRATTASVSGGVKDINDALNGLGDPVPIEKRIAQTKGAITNAKNAMIAALKAGDPVNAMLAAEQLVEAQKRLGALQGIVGGGTDAIIALFADAGIKVPQALSDMWVQANAKDGTGASKLRLQHAATARVVAEHARHMKIDVVEETRAAAEAGPALFRAGQQPARVAASGMASNLSSPFGTAWQSLFPTYADHAAGGLVSTFRGYADDAADASALVAKGLRKHLAFSSPPPGPLNSIRSWVPHMFDQLIGSGQRQLGRLSAFSEQVAAAMAFERPAFALADLGGVFAPLQQSLAVAGEATVHHTFGEIRVRGEGDLSPAAAGALGRGIGAGLLDGEEMLRAKRRAQTLPVTRP